VEGSSFTFDTTLMANSVSLVELTQP